MVAREQWMGGKVLICRRSSWEVGRRGLDADMRAGEEEGKRERIEGKRTREGKRGEEGRLRGRRGEEGKKRGRERIEAAMY